MKITADWNTEQNSGEKNSEGAQLKTENIQTENWNNKILKSETLTLGLAACLRCAVSFGASFTWTIPLNSLVDKVAAWSVNLLHPYIASCHLFNSDTLFVHLCNTSILSYFIKLQPSRCHPYSQINKCLGPFKTILHINHHYSMSNNSETETLEAYTSPFFFSISYIFLSLCKSLFFCLLMHADS